MIVAYVVDLDKAYRKYHPLVAARVKGKIGSETPEWEDVVSKVFLSLVEFTKGGKFRGESQVGTLLFRITERRVADYLRQKYKMEGGVPLPESVLFDTIVTQVEERQFLSAVMSAMDCLTPRQQQVFTLCGLEELTAPEAAERLGLSKSRVQKAYMRSRERIAEEMENWRMTEIDPATLIGWTERLWLAFNRLGQRTGMMDIKTEHFARLAKEEIIRRLGGQNEPEKTDL